VLVSRWSQPQTLKWGLVASTTISQWSCVSTQTIYSQTRIMMSPLGPWNNFFIRQVTFKYMWQLKRGDRMAGLTVWSKEVIAWQVWLYDQKRWSHGRFDCMIKRKTTNRQTRPTKHYTENLRLSYTKPTTAGDLMFSGGYVVPALLVEPVV
jgi:hypothetical protein